MAVRRLAFACGSIGRLRTTRWNSTPANSDAYTAVHFRLTPHEHPLKTYSWKNPTQNHVWTEEEVNAALSVKPHLEPQTRLDRAIYSLLQCAYHTFNFLTGYKKEDPTPESVELRLIFLESIAGVPGMVAASQRHFRSLRTMKRDYGWIHTLLEEAENERMHLLVFMRMFNPGIITRVMVIVAQGVLVTLLTGTYAVCPRALHRFVGYLEEMAVRTYTEVVHHVQTPGSKLHNAWSVLPAPEIARNYWRLPGNAMFVDVLRHIGADETHHRDVNHTFASMGLYDTNPYVLKHLDDAATAWRTPSTGRDLQLTNVPRGVA